MMINSVACLDPDNPSPWRPFGTLDDNFKAENGATVVVPKSHLWDDRRPEKMEVDWSWVLVMHFWQWNGCFCCNFFRAPIGKSGSDRGED